MVGWSGEKEVWRLEESLSPVWEGERLRLKRKGLLEVCGWERGEDGDEAMEVDRWSCCSAHDTIGSLMYGEH